MGVPPGTHARGVGALGHAACLARNPKGSCAESPHALHAGAPPGWECRLETALAGGPWAMLRSPGPGPAAYHTREQFAACAPRAIFGNASRALTLNRVASACHK